MNLAQRRDLLAGPAFFLALALTAAPDAGAAPSAFRLNQLGFQPAAPKTAAVVGATSAEFFVLGPGPSDTAFRGQLSEEAAWDPSGERARIADFSALSAPGRYTLAAPGLGTSHPFEVGQAVHSALVRGSLRAFYYQRASVALDKAHAGKWARAAGHPDRRVYIHPSAATESRPAETVVQSPRGWYDAGDYNKYVVNSGISTYTLLALYRQFPSVFDTLGLGIPESGDEVPDILDEVLWNLRWMMSMQDPNDGGAYHKLTTANFSGSVMPEADLAKRYLVQKSVTATLDLAAVCAYASRVFRKFDKQLPGFADSSLAVARKAWDWARANPTALYRQTEMNKTHTPQIVTGEYGDANALDELQWAGVELYLATGIDSFYVAAYPTALPTLVGTPGWPNVATLAFYSMADEGGPQRPLIDTAAVRQRLRAAGTALAKAVSASAFRVPMTARDFFWGSNSGAANSGMLLVQAYRASGDGSYLRPAVDALDYLLGRNGPGVSFVTGFGSVSPKNPHHRPSEADGLDEPVPGFLVGGPNTGRQDNCTYPSTLPALSWSDTQCSYASNEVAINWNAPLAYLSGALHALYSGAAGPISIGPAPGAGKRPVARLAWEGGAPALVLPASMRGTLELFDGAGRAWTPRGDTARAGRERPGLLFYRLRVAGKGGAPIVRTGSWATAAALRIPL